MEELVKAKVDEELANISSNIEGRESRSSSNKTAKEVAAVILPSLANIISVGVSTAITTALKDFTDKMESRANEMQRYCLLNKYENDKLELYSRRDNLRISGLVEDEDKSEEVLEAKIIELADNIGVKLKPDEYQLTHRWESLEKEVGQ
ncbi:hypothetical protein GWK47_008900 [Chionoecetes opilio]|uniref:Uncharacterized protein n=1 Tax=Chionoecetes opilio TaxID=41210 RepID=A0A8J4XZ25_CHIOP|nr:hypothetical protein GWK47_008900 [Chionoecetes opilio]